MMCENVTAAFLAEPADDWLICCEQHNWNRKSNKKAANSKGKRAEINYFFLHLLDHETFNMCFWLTKLIQKMCQ